MDKKAGKSGRKSVLLGMLDNMGSKARAGLCNSAIGNFFSSYDKASEKFERSTTYKFAQKTLKNPNVSKVRRIGSAYFDNSYVRRTVLSVTRAMRHCTARFYGIFFISFAMYVSLMFLIRKYGMFYSAPVSYLFVSLAAVVAALPLLTDRKRTIGAVFLDSKFFSWLLFDFFELRYETFRDEDPPIDRGTTAFISGMIYGCLSFFVSPITLLFLLLFFVYLYLTLVSPESGFLVALFCIPFLSFFEHPTIMLCILVLCVIAGYCVKLFRQKRVFRFGIFEGILTMFMLIVLFGGLRNASGGISSEMVVFLALMCGMFLASNLLRTKPMIIHAVRAFTLSSVVCAVVGIAEYVLGWAALEWIDTSMFSGINGRAVAFFENPNVLGTYLCFGAPLSLALMSISKDKSKSRWFAGFVFIVICSVFTWSRGAWIGMLVSVIMMLICTRHLFMVVVGGLILVPFASYIVPQSVLDRFMSIGNTADTSTMYRLNIWRGCADMAREHGLSGIGVGEDAFLRLYPKYAVAGAETTYHSHSLWLQIVLMLGVVGLAVFAVLLFFFYQRSFTVMKNCGDEDKGYIVAGAMSGISGLLAAGLFDYAWYNYRVFFIFFVMMGIVCACDLTSTKEDGGLHGYDR